MVSLYFYFLFILMFIVLTSSFLLVFFLILLLPPRSTRTDTLFPYTTLFRSFNKFRLSQVTGIELAGEQKGVIIPPSDPEGSPIRYSNMAFGQDRKSTRLNSSH